MTRRFQAKFANGVLVPNQRVDLPSDRELTVIVDEAPVSPGPPMPRYDDPNDPMPLGGQAMLDWWKRHRLPIDPASAQRIAQSKAYGYYEEPEDDA